MTTPFAFAGSFQLPPDSGSPADPIAFNMSSQFDSLNEQVLNLTGSGTKVIPFGTVPAAGLKGLLLKVDANPTGTPVTVAINGGTPFEVSPGGFVALGSPAPVAGVTAISVTHTSANKVRVWALG